MGIQALHHYLNQSGKYPVEDYVQNEILVKGTRVDEFYVRIIK